MTIDRAAQKKEAAERSLRFVGPDMVLGLGSGSTAAEVVKQLGARMRAGLRIRGGVPSSGDTARLAEQEGIPLLTLDQVATLDVTIDGADEVDPAGNMIKGRGGALLYEKVIASHSRQLVIVIDGSKRVETLGVVAPVPIEVVPFAAAAVGRDLEAMGASRVVPRLNGGALFVTDAGNHIFDCYFGPVPDPVALATRIDGLVGVVEHGLFVGFKPTLVVGGEDGVIG